MVFPSEVAAEYWRRNAVRSFDEGLVAGNRFVSWDTFKERTLGRHSEARPANSTIRRIFSALVCEGNEDTTRLRALIPPEFAPRSKRFAKSISRLLPFIPQAIDAARQGTIAPPEELLSDLRFLLYEYEGFLARRGLFEPAFASPGVEFPPDTILVYPELVADFPRYSRLSSRATIVRTTLPESVRLGLFSNVKDEAAALASAITELLLRGVHPGDIVISVAGLDWAAPHLLEAGSNRSLPLDLRSGKMLSLYPAGSMFRNVSRCVERRFDLETFHALLLDPQLPWRNRELNLSLVRFGVVHRCGRNGIKDQWGERLAAAGERRLLGYYRSIRDAMSRLVTAPTVAELRSLAVAFSNEFLDLRRLSATSLREFEAVLRSLSRLESIAAAVGNDSLVEPPFNLWSAMMEEQIYVRKTSRGPGSIAVYPYRVAAGIHPRHHFVINCGDPEARVTHDPYSQLPTHLRRVNSRDATDHFVNAYAFSGTSVRFSASESTGSGPMRLPPLLAKAHADTEVEHGRHYRREKTYWRGEAVAPIHLYSTQIGGWRRFLDRRPIGSDFTRERCGDPTLADTLRGRRTDETGRLGISATAVDTWSHCAFAYLVSDLLGIEEPQYTVPAIDPLLEGTLLHELAAALFAPESRADEAAIDGLLDRLVERSPTRFPNPNPLVLDERITAMRRMLCALANSSLGGESIVAVERRLQMTIGRVVVTGRVDRISSAESGLKIVDYKRSRIPTRASLHPLERAGSYQIPLYTLMTEEAVGPVETASYYSFHREKESVVFGRSGWLKELDFERYVAATRLQIERLEHRIDAGDYTFPKRIGGCEGCPVRPICRQKYVR